MGLHGSARVGQRLVSWAAPVVGQKLSAALLIAGSLCWGGLFNFQQFQAVAATWPPRGPPNGTSQLATWDGAHYLHLAAESYRHGDPSCAFYPLWPLLIRTTAPLLGGSLLITGLLLANVFSAAGLWLFHRLVAERHGEKAAHTSLVLMLAFPGALFLSFIYTESLFFFLAMLFLWGLVAERAWLVSLAGFLLPLARPVGIFMLLPLGWHLLESGSRKWREEKPELRVAKPEPAQHRQAAWGRLVRAIAWQRIWLGVPAVLAGYATYFGMMYAATGNPFEGFEAQKHYPNSPSIANILNVSAFVRAFVAVDSLHSMTGSAIDRALFLLFLVTLPAVWRLDRRYFWYAIGTGLAPAMSNWFFSYSRFQILCFPVFIVLGRWLSGPEKRWLLWYYVALAGCVQIWFLMRHINFYWAG